MRTYFAFFMASLAILTALPAAAGNLTFANGQASWQSTQCTEPVSPGTFDHISPEIRAEKMNVFMAQYNQYAQQVQSYMDCISGEAQKDSDTASQTIVHSAQDVIANEQKKLSAVGTSLQTSK